MIIFTALLTVLCGSQVTYSYSQATLTISGTGTITKDGIRDNSEYTKMTNVIINEGISKIETQSFLECSSLIRIEIPSTVTKIGSSSFNRCEKLSQLVVDENNPNYKSDSQNGLYTKDMKHLIRAPVIENFKIPETVEQIESNAFATHRNGYMGNIVLPNSLTTLKAASFAEGMFGNIEFDSDPHLEKIASQSSTWMTAESFMIPKSCTLIESRAFEYSTINQIVFQQTSSLKEIGSSAFLSVYNLVSISLPDSLQIINDNAFQGTKIHYVYIGANCNNISMSAFSMCSNLTEINISPQNQNYSFFGGLLMDKSESKLLFIPPGLTNITIQSTVTDIGETILQNQQQLTDITLQSTDNFQTENGVLYSNDFKTLVAVCGGITSVNARGEVESVGPKAAQGCTKLISFAFIGYNYM